MRGNEGEEEKEIRLIKLFSGRKENRRRREDETRRKEDEKHKGRERSSDGQEETDCRTVLVRAFAQALVW